MATDAPGSLSSTVFDLGFIGFGLSTKIQLLTKLSQYKYKSIIIFDRQKEKPEPEYYSFFCDESYIPKSWPLQIYRQFTVEKKIIDLPGTYKYCCLEQTAFNHFVSDRLSMLNIRFVDDYLDGYEKQAEGFVLKGQNTQAVCKEVFSSASSTLQKNQVYMEYASCKLKKGDSTVPVFYQGLEMDNTQAFLHAMPIGDYIYLQVTRYCLPEKVVCSIEQLLENYLGSTEQFLHWCKSPRILNLPN